MLKLAKIFFASIIAASFIGAPLTASARDKDKADDISARAASIPGPAPPDAKKTAVPVKPLPALNQNA